MSPIYKNGKYGYKVVISYKATDGSYKKLVRCNEHTRTKTDAKRYEAQLVATIKTEATSDTLVFEQLYYKFLQERKNQIKKNTLAYYESVIPVYVFPMFKKVKIENITKEKIIKWKSWLEDSHNFGVVYLNNIFKCFSAVMNYAVKFYDLPYNPLTKVGKFKAPEVVKEDDINFWTLDEFRKFYAAGQKHLETEKVAYNKLRWSALMTTYAILFWAGLRRSEALALNWKDIIQVNGIQFLNVYKSINQRISPYEITTTKNKSSIRKVPICNELSSVLMEHKSISMRCAGFDEDFFICGSIDPLAKNSIGEIKKKLEQEADVKHIRIHDLRHSYCSLLINGGFPLLTIARLMGHSTTEITQKVYAHIYPDANHQVLEFMNRLQDK